MVHFLGKIRRVFWATYASILNLGWECAYVRATKELKKKAFRINGQNKNLEIAIQMTFILETKHQKYIFLSKLDHISSDLCVEFESLLGWECPYVCYNLRTEKEASYVKNRKYKRKSFHPNYLSFGN